ncbi:hypothetical protein MPTK1_2g06310 [Marchantia polymorpha subsp. ruderalis]|nr:hypothetical protein MARPO_0021s0086 [Marchantia polymorpha]BBN01303.1 hypothetical protein Mp_2g06310 [Marchantia polymorpha subsp. ruderalis]|eukprot:PTQ44228.1 hypothetical protein MARPO_0021s0086 [Marchantia polymorpha]
MDPSMTIVVTRKEKLGTMAVAQNLLVGGEQSGQISVSGIAHDGKSNLLLPASSVSAFEKASMEFHSVSGASMAFHRIFQL